MKQYARLTAGKYVFMGQYQTNKVHYFPVDEFDLNDVSYVASRCVSTPGANRSRDAIGGGLFDVYGRYGYLVSS